MAESPALEAYGRLTEGIHITGYTFARACTNLEWLLADDRWKACGEFRDVNAFLDSLRLDQFRPVAETRKRIAARIKSLQPKASNRQIARTLGVSHQSIGRDTGPNGPLTIENAKQSGPSTTGNGPNGPPSSLTGEEAARAAQKLASKEIAGEETKQRRAQSRAATPLVNGMELRVGDCRTALADIPDNSVPLILTDPPYGDEAEPLYEWLAQWSARVLIPGGSLICYTGQSRLDRDMDILGSRLRYWWLLIMPHQQSQRLPGKFVIANFKPVLWHVKDHRRGRSLMPDMLKSPARDKSLHDWQQGEGGVWQIIEHLTDPAELIVDPFAGTGNWGRTAAAMGRRWLGVDVVTGGAAVVAAE